MNGWDLFEYGAHSSVPKKYANATKQVAMFVTKDKLIAVIVNAGDFAAYLRGELAIERIRTKRSDA